MELEELLQREENKDIVQLEHALSIAQTEWNNIRKSLSLCSDIGEFCKKDFMIGIIEEDVIVRLPKISPTKSVSGYCPSYYPMYFVKNMETMNEKFESKGYRTTEALYSFIELATKAAGRLGLKGNICMGFGVGYANVRTGWVAEKGLQREREIFEKMFFEGKFKHYDWECDWTSVQQVLKEIFDRFKSWQDDETLYRYETDSKKIVRPLLV